MSPADLRWTLAPERERVKVLLEGELDLSTAATFQQAVLELMDNGWSTIVVDLARVGFMDSSGLRAALELDSEATRRGIGLRLEEARAPVRRLFALTGVDGRLAGNGRRV